jgi:hypothetical protein
MTRSKAVGLKRVRTAEGWEIAGYQVRRRGASNGLKFLIDRPDGTRLGQPATLAIAIQFIKADIERRERENT